MDQRGNDRVQDHPRSRGEHSQDDTIGPKGHGSSPLARGARYYIAAINEADRIIPARAGSTIFPSSWGTATWDHPRSRGEHT